MMMNSDVTLPNKTYLAPCLRHSAKIPRYARNFRYAQPLYAIVSKRLERDVEVSHGRHW